MARALSVSNICKWSEDALPDRSHMMPLLNQRGSQGSECQLVTVEWMWVQDENVEPIAGAGKAQPE